MSVTACIGTRKTISRMLLSTCISNFSMVMVNQVCANLLQYLIRNNLKNKNSEKFILNNKNNSLQT